MDLNQVNLIGRLTRDPELKTIASGQSLCVFSVACGRKFKGQDGSLKEETTFIDCTAWGTTAQNMAKYLKKGSRLHVGGRLRLETWEDRNGGGKRSKISLVAENVIFLDKNQDSTLISNPPAAVTAGMWDNSEPDLGEPPF